MIGKSSVATVLAALAASSPAYAWWRVACTSPLVSGQIPPVICHLNLCADRRPPTERVDPVINPGSIPSQHVHVRRLISCRIY